MVLSQVVVSAHAVRLDVNTALPLACRCRPQLATWQVERHMAAMNQGRMFMDLWHSLQNSLLQGSLSQVLHQHGTYSNRVAAGTIAILMHDIGYHWLRAPSMLCISDIALPFQHIQPIQALCFGIPRAAGPHSSLRRLLVEEAATLEPETNAG